MKQAELLTVLTILNTKINYPKPQLRISARHQNAERSGTISYTIKYCEARLYFQASFVVYM